MFETGAISLGLFDRAGGGSGGQKGKEKGTLQYGR